MSETNNPKCLSFCTGILLAASILCSAASAQNPKSKSKPNQDAQTSTKPLKNPNQPRRQAAMDELAMATYERMKVDPRFRDYVSYVNKNNADTAEFVKARKGGGQ
jgi:hypothetical protein